MAHGFSGVKEQIEHYAACFAAAGFAALVYDHRGFGASDGTPRLEVDPAVQLVDWRDAITFALTQPEIDASAGVGLWGSSLAGGMAMVVAANDRRVRCVVAQIPHVSGHRNGRAMFDATQRAELDARFAEDRVARFAGAEPAMIPVFATSPGEACALPPATTKKRLDAAIAQAPSCRNEVTLRSVENMNQFEPAGWAAYIAPTPFLMIVATNDTCTFPDIQLAVFAGAREPKRLVIHPGGHFDTYTDHFEPTSRAAVAWFGEHLARPQSIAR